MAGAVFGEIWNGSWSTKCCICPHKMRAASTKGNLSCAAGCRLTGSRSDHARIVVGACSDRPRILNDVSAVFRKFLCMIFWNVIFRCGRNIWYRRVAPLAPRIVLDVDVSYVTKITHESHFSWQAQDLKLAGFGR